MRNIFDIKHIDDMGDEYKFKIPNTDGFIVMFNSYPPAEINISFSIDEKFLDKKNIPLNGHTKNSLLKIIMLAAQEYQNKYYLTNEEQIIRSIII